MDAPADPVEAFIARWDGTAMAERANAHLFLSEMCDVLHVPRPDPAKGFAVLPMRWIVERTIA